MFGDILTVLIFILLAGLFVAAEIALISLRESQVRGLEAKGGRGLTVGRLVSNPNRFLAAAQEGVTFCGFFSAAFGSTRISERIIPTLERWGASPQWSSALALIIITIALSYVSLVLGELVPKRLALAKTESIAVIFAGTINRIAIIFTPIIWFLSVSTNAIVRIFGIGARQEKNAISEAELVELVTGHSALSVEERDIVEEVFNASDLSLHEIMVPRTEVDFLDVGLTIDEAINHVLPDGHSRYPITRGSSDEVLGFIHIRDLLNARTRAGSEKKTILDLIRPVTFLPGTKGVLQALAQMRAEKSHIAIVLDEYGGTDGIVTLEDLMERLIGDIHDEFDIESPEISDADAKGEFDVTALTSLEDLFEKTGIAIGDGPYETIGGYLMHELGKIPSVGDYIVRNGVKFSVLTVEGKRAGQIHISHMEG